MCHHEHVLQTKPPAAAEIARAILESRQQIGARQPERGTEAEEHRRDRAEAHGRRGTRRSGAASNAIVTGEKAAIVATSRLVAHTASSEAEHAAGAASTNPSTSS